MVQKLLIIERDTKAELQKAIEKNVLQQENMRLVSFSVLEQDTEGLFNANIEYDEDGNVIDKTKYFEAWCVVAVPDKNDKFYNDVMGMSE